MEKLNEYKDLLWDYIMAHGTNVIVALVVLIIGLQVIKVFTRTSSKIMDKRGYDPSLTSWLRTLMSILLKVMLVISVLGMMGIEMTSFVAILGAAGLAVGLALQGTLQNFAGGVMILIFKPYKVGDVIDAAGYVGGVKEIQIFNTILTTPDNKVIIIPNGTLATGSLTNFSKQETRRVDWTFGIGYGDSYDKAKDILLKFIGEDDRIMKDPEPFIGLSELADSSVNIAVRVWCKGEDYWGIFFDMNERVYKEFDKEGLNIPYPQMDVHVHKD